MANSQIIEFKNISKSFGAVHALKDVSFGIARGECHAIVGENGAGKSTLMNILSGLFPQDTGDVLLNGKAVRITSPIVSGELGIATVYQELKLCPNLTAPENIFLGRTAVNRLGMIKKGTNDAEAKKLLDLFGIDVDVSVPVRSLSIAQMQLVELAKALSRKTDVLILDEPTSSLTAAESDRLFDIVAKLKADGKTMIFISHRLDEIFKIADRVTVMRDGKYIGTYPCAQLTEERVVELIAGRKLEKSALPAAAQDSRTGVPALEVRGLSWRNRVVDASLKLYKGEILGIYGLQGAGRTELVETIFGLNRLDAGEIFINGEKKTIKKPSQALKTGVGLITEDRKNRGIFAKMSISENIAAIHTKGITSIPGVLDWRAALRMTQRYHGELSIKMDSHKQNITKLSGGNQQKVIIARMLSRKPDIILADEPTRGVDVGAKSEIFSIFRELKKAGKAIIVISSELKEVAAECDRIIVMKNGRIVGEVTARECREEQILQYSFNGEDTSDDQQGTNTHSL